MDHCFLAHGRERERDTQMICAVQKPGQHFQRKRTLAFLREHGYELRTVLLKCDGDFRPRHSWTNSPQEETKYR